MKAKATKLFDDAEAQLKQAKEEIYRPKEDLVPFLVCKNSQLAIENYLRGYLLSNGIETSNLKTIDDLFLKCKELNYHFGKINLSPIRCSSVKVAAKVCDDVEKVCSCFNTAERLNSFLKTENIIK